jgi:calcineurin-like phosphoesterase family protein
MKVSMGRTLLISDTHFNHDNLKTYCDRPSDFTERIIKNWRERVKPIDTVIHLGDVGIGPISGIMEILVQLLGRKILVRGNHDRKKSCQWWMNHGFDFACDAMMFKNWWLTHEPAQSLPWTEGKHCRGNIHGHLHNIFHGFHPRNGEKEPSYSKTSLKYSWQRLFSVEYTNYCPIEFEEFTNHPDKYLARGITPRSYLQQH